MELKMRSLTRWSAAPAKDVETAVSPKVNVLRGLVARATTPLLPDDYLKLLNPLWSARELRGVVVDVCKETEDSATVTYQAGMGLFRGLPARPVSGDRASGRWPLALAVLLAHVDPGARQKTGLDHRESNP